jgi:hypothetical protein
LVKAATGFEEKRRKAEEKKVEARTQEQERRGSKND